MNNSNDVNKRGVKTNAWHNGVRILAGSLALVGALTVGAHDAHAATATLPDDFESGGWAFGVTNPSQGGGFMTTWSLAHSPSHIAFMYFLSGASASDWQEVSKTFTTAVTPIACSGSAYVNGTGGGGPGAIEMIDPATWSYIGSQPITVSGTSWVKVTVTNSYACKKSIVLRVILDGTPGRTNEIYVDDASVTWTF